MANFSPIVRSDAEANISEMCIRPFVFPPTSSSEWEQDITDCDIQRHFRLFWLYNHQPISIQCSVNVNNYCNSRTLWNVFIRLRLQLHLTKITLILRILSIRLIYRVVVENIAWEQHLIQILLALRFIK